MPTVVDVVSRWLFQLYRFNRLWHHLLPRVELHHLKRPQGSLKYERSTALPFRGLGADEVNNANPSSTYKVCGEVREARIDDMGPDEYYGLTFYNNSDVGLFLYIFYFDPITFEIVVMLLSSSYP